MTNTVQAKKKTSTAISTTISLRALNNRTPPHSTLHAIKLKN